MSLNDALAMAAKFDTVAIEYLTLHAAITQPPPCEPLSLRVQCYV